MKIAPARYLRGTLEMPGDKSISHRAAIISALAARDDKTTRIENYATGADCLSTLRCLAQLGVEVARDGATVQIRNPHHRSDQTDHGNRHSRFSQPLAPLDCGNSGTTMRLLAGVLAAQPFASTLTGDASLRNRPMRRIIEPLTRMGARISSENERAPLNFDGLSDGDSLAAIEHDSEVLSAQVKSCLLLAGLFARSRTNVTERGAQTRDHTERLLRYLGADVETRFDAEANVYRASIAGADLHRLAPRDVEIPGDVSSAAYFIAAAALLPDSNIEIKNVGLNPTRTALIRTLESLGATATQAQIETLNAREKCFEMRGDVRVRRKKLVRGESNATSPRASSPSSTLPPFTLQGSQIAELIDELPLLAVVGTQLEGGLLIRDAAELRVKESDRIKATAENLRRMNARVEEFSDGLRVHGRARLRGAEIDTYGDHRIAMSFAVAALLAEGETEIKDAECVAVSFPEFFRLLEQVAIR